MGGPGADTVNGGLGDDQLDGAEDDDMLDGASGNDTLKGGAGRDTIRGSDGRDTATGGAGGDLLFGGAGDDRVLTGPRGDAVDAGGDDDDVLAADGAAGPIACDTGEDAVAPHRGDRVHIDCETVHRSVRCPARWRSRCGVRATLSTAGRRAIILGRGSTRVRRGGTRTVRVPLSPRAQRHVRRAKKIDVRLALTYSAGTHHRGPVGTTFSLHAKLPSPVAR
jgi:Ca2+-binding RTX toxin-like protein